MMFPKVIELVRKCHTINLWSAKYKIVAQYGSILLRDRSIVLKRDLRYFHGLTATNEPKVATQTRTEVFAVADRAMVASFTRCSVDHDDCAGHLVQVGYDPRGEECSDAFRNCYVLGDHPSNVDG